jgi:DNA-binding transcriptional LysR family regulator
MSKIDDMALFVRVVKADGLAAAGRQLGLSPASMTARVNAIEQRYSIRLLNRTTRKISLTEAGRDFYEGCLRVLAEVEDAEAVLQDKKRALSGRLRITAASDFGRQFVAPALAKFVTLHPEVIPYLHLGDGVMSLVEHEFDLGIRYGNLPDSNLVVRNLADNFRVLVVSPEYIKENGIPSQPKDLQEHSCLVMERAGEPLNKWQFDSGTKVETLTVAPAFSSNDGAVIRQWALAGLGIAYKSSWDVKGDIEEGRLVTVLDDYVVGFQERDSKETGLQVVYPSRRYMPRQVEGFIKYFQNWMEEKY